MRGPTALLLALLVAGGALTVWGERLATDRDLLSLHGPFAARHDPANGTTVLAAACWYCPRPPAFLLEGDARALAERPEVHLLNEGPDFYAQVEVAPFEVDGQPVTSASAGPFRAVSIGWRLGVLVAGLALLGAAGALALARRDVASLAGGLAWSAAGLAWGGFAATQGDGGIGLLMGGVLVAVLVGVAGLASPRTRRHAAGFLLALPLALAATIWLSNYFPGSPAV